MGDRIHSAEKFDVEPSVFFSVSGAESLMILKIVLITNYSIIYFIYTIKSVILGLDQPFFSLHRVLRRAKHVAHAHVVVPQVVAPGEHLEVVSMRHQFVDFLNHLLGLH